MRRRLLLGLASASLLAGPAWAQEAAEAQGVPSALSADVAARYAIHAMLSANAYHHAHRVRFPVETLGWVQVDEDGQPSEQPTRRRRSGLAYDIFEKRGTNEVIFAFRGTDSARDYATANLTVWPFSVQYTQANKAFAEYLKRHADKKVTLAGHSLGGGLALSMSVRYGVDAVVFNSSPRLFAGPPTRFKPATRVMIYEGGEALSRVRAVWRQLLEVIPQENVYQASFDFGGQNRHRSDLLALGLLNLGSSVDPGLAALQQALPPTTTPAP